jgi:hypothetical protein
MIFKDHVQWPSNKPVSEEEKKRGILSELEEYALLEKELEEKIGHRWPATIKWHPSRITKIEDKETIGGFRLERPPFYPMTLSWVAKGIGKDDRKHTWTYCDDYIPNSTNKELNQYLPTTRDLSGDDMFTKDGIVFSKELLMWMFLAEPNLEGGKNKTNSRNFMVFDLPHLDKQKSDDYNRILSEVMMQISNPKYGLPIAALRKMLTSYFVDNVDTMEEYEVRDTMHRKATEGANQADQIANMKIFLSRVDNPEGLRVRWLCKKALDAKMIVWSEKRRTYNLVMDGQEVTPPLCVVRPDQDRLQTLHEVMGGIQENKEYLKMIELFIEGKAKDKVTEEPVEGVAEVEEKIPTVESPFPRTYGFQKKIK